MKLDKITTSDLMTELSRRNGVDTTTPDGADIVLTIRDVQSLGDNKEFEFSYSDDPEYLLKQFQDIFKLLSTGWRCVDQFWAGGHLFIALRLTERQVESS